jgi:DNA-binding transcriptional MerR regulator
MTPRAASTSEARTPEPMPYRMKDLCERTGLSRQAIHFYIQQGLLPEGRKTGRNMAWYGEAHVERLALIRRLQEERFLPLKAIRALLDDETAHLAASQRSLLLEVKSRLPPRLRGDDAPNAIDIADAAARHGVALAEVEQMVAAGVLPVREADGKRTIPTTSQWILDAWAQLRALGFSQDNGFTPEDIAIYEEAASALVRREATMLIGRMSHLPAAQLATLIEKALPIIHASFIQFHTTAVRTFFAAVDLQVAPGDPEAP